MMSACAAGSGSGVPPLTMGGHNPDAAGNGPEASRSVPKVAPPGAAHLMLSPLIAQLAGFFLLALFVTNEAFASLRPSGAAFAPIVTSTGLPHHACTNSPRFAYLVCISGEAFPAHNTDFTALLADDDAQNFYITWREPLAPFPFHPGSFGENRNYLLELAVEAEKKRGCRFLYYIFLDEHAPALRTNSETAALDGIRTDIAPFLAFRQLLLEWMPAVGVPRYSFMPRFDLSHTTPAHTIVNFDHVIVAVHFTAARFLLPYASDLEPFHWIHAQALMDLEASMLFLESSLVFRSIESFPKAPHQSATASNNPNKPFDAALTADYLRNSVLDSSPLARRIFPINAVLANGLERKNPLSVRFDVDLRDLEIKADHVVWTRANAFWARLGASNGGGFLDLVDSANYTKLLTDCVTNTCVV
jgi:hypothetical protein